MDDEERRLLRESLEHTITTSPADSLRDALRAFGWHELLAEDPETAVAVIGDLEGQHLPPVSLLDDVMLVAADVSTDLRLVLPDLRSADPTSCLTDGTLSVRGILAAPVTGSYVVPAWSDGDVVLITTELDGAIVSGDAGIDPASSWRAVVAEVKVDGAAVVDGAAAREQWIAMRSAGHRALAHQLARIGRCMLELAVDHVKTRRQFGHALGSFQAVKHALAEVSLWAECADLAATAAWEDRCPESAQLAKILAGRLIRTASENCQQVMGGMGFTWEHRFHRYLRRALVLEPMLGSAAQLRSELGAQLRTAGVPTLVHL